MVAITTNTNLVAVDFDPFAGPAIARLAPLTESQAELWTSCQLGGDDANRAYNESISLRFVGWLDQTAFERALRALVDRHEALRSAFSGDGRQICVFEELPITLAYQDCTHKIDAEQQQIISDYVTGDALYRFDLVNGPLFKVGLIKLSDTVHHFTLTAHHLVCDGWSVGILLQDLSALYSAYAQHTVPNLPAAVPYSQYATEQAVFIQSDAYGQIERFWVDQLKQPAPVLNLPTDFPRPAYRTYKSSRRDFRLDAGLALATKQMGVRAGCSLVTTLMAAFEVLLHRVTGQDDLVLGLPAAGQSATGHLRLVGHCVNLLPLRSSPRSDRSFLDYLKQRREEVLDAYEHQQLTFGSLLKKLPIARDPSRVPLVPVIFNVDMGLDDGVDFQGLSYELISNPRQYETVDLFLNIGGSASSLTFEWSYNTQLFNGDTIGRLMAEFERVLQAVVANPSVKIGAIPLTNPDELLSKLARWNATQAGYPLTTPLHQLLARTATKYADKTALIVNDQPFSYQSLHEASNQLARYIQNRGIRSGSVVGVALDRSPELIITLLAVLKAGAAYVPLDPDYPHDRLAFMLVDSSADMLITARRYAGRMDHRATEVLIEPALAESVAYSTETPELVGTGNDLAYILYTSGSTGRPKGVLIEHRNLVNLLYSMIDWPGITSDDVLLGVTTISFDIAGLELFLPLLVGATLVLADAQTTKDGRALLQAVSEPNPTGQRITLLQATPATYKLMLAAGWEQRLPLKVLCCGEPMSNDLAQKLTARCGTLWNMYGPTETTIYSTGKQILATDETITIGRPIQNTQVYILDDQRNPLPEGVVGEIYLGGDGVARGYLNRPELTTEKFVPNPFGTSGRGTLYRTGDLGKFTANGEIHCLGRIDHQVKIRGYRIELGEIESTLARISDISEAVVIAREDRPGDQRLVAYVVPKSRPLNGQASGAPAQHTTVHTALPEQVRNWKKQAGEILPDYMVPTDFVLLSALPLTPNGKIDRKALPKPDQPTPSGEKRSVKPQNKEEELLLSIWTDLLDRKSISVQDDFFELGGHSLIAVQMMVRLQKETGRKLPLASLFEHSTIEKLARLLKTEQEAISWNSLVPIKPQGSKLPLYIVHGAGLHVLLFNALAASLNPEQPVYGLQAKGLDGKDEPLPSIEAIAAHYVAEVMAQNPNGPYVLAGYSLGGLIAYEMARQFMAMGKKVERLAMFDTGAPETNLNDPASGSSLSSSRMFFNNVIHTLRLLGQDPGRTIVYKTESIERKLVERYWRMRESRKLPHRVMRGLIRFYWRMKFQEEQRHDVFNNLAYKIEMINARALRNYQPPPADVAVDLFRAKKQVFFMEDFDYLGWKPFALRGVTVHDIPGDHNSIFSPPNDQEFARVLQQVLDSRNP